MSKKKEGGPRILLQVPLNIMVNLPVDTFNAVAAAINEAREKGARNWVQVAANSAGVLPSVVQGVYRRMVQRVEALERRRQAGDEPPSQG